MADPPHAAGSAIWPTWLQTTRRIVGDSDSKLIDADAAIGVDGDQAQIIRADAGDFGSLDDAAVGFH